MMGVSKKDRQDEFDEINLSNYRSNEDFKWVQLKWNWF
jgi:hypothetical protein